MDKEIHKFIAMLGPMGAVINGSADTVGRNSVGDLRFVTFQL
jgi:hypothetical protein